MNRRKFLQVAGYGVSAFLLLGQRSLPQHSNDNAVKIHEDLKLISSSVVAFTEAYLGHISEIQRKIWASLRIPPEFVDYTTPLRRSATEYRAASHFHRISAFQRPLKMEVA